MKKELGDFMLFFQLALLFLILLPVIFFLAKRIARYIYSLVFQLTHSKKISVWIISFILLPGTAVHELSHFLVASILRVPTGQITIFPIFEKNGEVKAGKIEIGQADPFRLSVIGLAPMIVGLILLYITGRVFFTGLSQILNTKYLILNTLGIYLLFTISLTMFSSKKDLKSLLIAGPVILLIATSLYLTGVKIIFTDELMTKIVTVLSDLNFYLILTTIINFLMLTITSLILQFLQRSDGKSVV